jgi:hypothetical protein
LNSLLSADDGKIHFINPVEPGDVFSIASTFDIGMAAEVPYRENRNIRLTNKIFTYPLAGNCILASDTAAQKDFMNTYHGIGLLYKHDDAKGLSKQINRLYNNGDFLNECRYNALQLADKTLNRKNESERLYSVINEIIINDN